MYIYIVHNTLNSYIYMHLLTNFPCFIEETVVGAWAAWTGCSQTCGRGTRSRRRSCKRGDTPCPPDLSQTEQCILRICDTDGKSLFCYHSYLDFATQRKCDLLRGRLQLHMAAHLTR